VADLSPDVVLVDLDLGGESDFDVAARLADRVSSVIILIFTHSPEDREELIAGRPTRGFLHKSPVRTGAGTGDPAGAGRRRDGPTDLRRPAASRPGVQGCWASGVVGTWSTRFNAGELGAVNDGVRM